MIDAVALSAALLHAQPLPDVAPIQVDVQPGLWLTRIRGETTCGGAMFLLDEQMGVDDRMAAFRGGLTVSREPWTAKLMATSFAASGTARATGGTWAGQVVTAGDATAFETTWMQFELQWDKWPRRGDGSRRTNDPLDLIFGPHIGVSYLDLEQQLTNGGGATVRRSGEWWSATLGGHLALQADLRDMLPMIQQMRVEVAGGAGMSMGGGMVWSIRGGLTLMVSPNVGATLGYRLMQFNELEKDDWTVSPRFPGLFMGLNITF
ncbi:MAG: hypothetical protein MK074_08235 [Phycisphaerales bacterium]|nr:hypothetical protein [Phycisphaerales bacterium]